MTSRTYVTVAPTLSRRMLGMVRVSFCHPTLWRSSRRCSSGAPALLDARGQRLCGVKDCLGHCDSYSEEERSTGCGVEKEKK